MPWTELSCLSIIVNRNIGSFNTRHWRHGERMAEYLDKLIHLFRKARPVTPVSFQNEEVKNHLLTGLPAEAMGEVEGYVDLSAPEIA